MRGERSRVQPLRSVGVTGYYGDLVRVVEGEVGVDEDEDVGYCFGDGEGV